MGGEYRPRVGDDCWYWAVEMNKPIPVTIIGTVVNPTFADHKDTTNPFIERDRLLYRLQGANGKERRYPVRDETLFMKEEAKAYCRSWHQAGIACEKQRPRPESKRHIASTKRRMRELEAL